MKKRLENRRTLFQMWAVMICFGVVLELIALIAAKQRLYYSVGIWAGVAVSVVNSGLMLHAIDNMLDREGKGAVAYSVVWYVVRTVIALAVFFGLALSQIGSAAAAIVGMFSLKLSAYLQPYLQKLLDKRKLSEDGGCVKNE